MLALVGLEAWSVVFDPQDAPRRPPRHVPVGLAGLLGDPRRLARLQLLRALLSTELRRERLERRFSEARLNNLRLQLDPHFLFNALNTVSSQVERDPRLARG